MILSDIDKKGERSGEKEVIKVFVITGPETNGVVTYENEVSGQKVYSGIAWDTLEAAKKHPDLKKYKFEYTFSEPTVTYSISCIKICRSYFGSDDPNAPPACTL